MTTRSPRERLQKLFHKQESPSVKASNSSTPNGKGKEVGSSPPPVSPSSPSVRKQPQHVRDSSDGGGQLRRSSSRASLRDMMHTAGAMLGRSESKSRRRQSQLEPTQSPESHAYATAAAAKAMRPDQETRLPSIPHQPDLSSDLSSDLQEMTLSHEAGQLPHSEDVADRNIKRKPRKLETANGSIGGEQHMNGDIAPTSRGNVRSMVSDINRNSTDINRNSADVGSMLGGLHDIPAPLQVKKRASQDSRAGSIGAPLSPVKSTESRGLSHKPDITDLRHSMDSPAVPLRSPSRRSADGRIPRRSLDKPLPARPSDEYATELENGGPVITSTQPGPTSTRDLPTSADDSVPIDLSKVVDLSNTTDTTLHETWAPAVTHETITSTTHEILEQRITREIHEHHIFHRILPIIDIEVLPARHFVPLSDGNYAEIAEEEIPGRAGEKANWVVAEMVSKLLPESNAGPMVPERFTARKFEGAEGDYREYTTPDGVPRTEEWHVHPPTFEMGGIASGQTYPFYLGSPNPADDGLRARLPEGKVIGVSPLLAKQQLQRLEEQKSALLAQMGGEKGDGEVPPPVPAHRVFPAEMVDAVRAGPVAERNTIDRTV